MKKFFITLICAMMVLGVAGCSNNSESKENDANVNEAKETANIEEIMDKNGYVLLYREDLDSGAYEIYFKNETTNNAFSYSQNFVELFSVEGILYQYDSSNQLYTGNKWTNGSMSAEELKTKYDEELETLGITEDKLILFLKNKLKDKLDEIAKNEAEIDYFEAGTYEVGKDILAGEYIVKEDGDRPSYSIQSNPYNGSDTEVYLEDYIKGNDYINVVDGQYLILKNAKACKADSPLKLEVNSGGVFKVGRDIKAGIYEIKPSKPNNYYSITSYSNSDKPSHRNIIDNELDMSSPIQIKVNDDEYLELNHMILNEVK